MKLRDSNAIQIRENQQNIYLQLQISNPLLYFRWKISGLNDIFDWNNLQKDENILFTYRETRRKETKHRDLNLGKGDLGCCYKICGNV